MKTKRSHCLSHAAFVLALLPITGFAEQSNFAALVLPPSNAQITIAVTNLDEPPAISESAAVVPSVPGRLQWSDISDCTTEMRGKFFAGFQQLETLVNRQLDELAARRVAIRGAAATAELDLVIKEMNTARFFLQSTADALRRATSAQTWEQQKAKIGLAWAKSQQAYHKLKPHSAN